MRRDVSEIKVNVRVHEQHQTQVIKILGKPTGEEVNDNNQ